MKVDIELSEDDLIWLDGYIEGRTLCIQAGLDSITNVDKILERVLAGAPDNKTLMDESDVVIQIKKDVEDEIKVGNIVILSGFSLPLMRVEQRAKDFPYKGIHYLCVWFGPGENEHKVWFHENTLVVHKT